MEMRIRESNGTFKVTVTSLTGHELAVYREMLGGITFELREIEEADAFAVVASEKFDALEFERVPMFRAEDVVAVEEAAVAVEEVAAVAVDEAAAEREFIKNTARDNDLFHKLSDLRRQLAKAESVAPYLIFHDKTLWGMVEKMPSDLPALGNISGVGKAKLEKYGTTFLSALKQGA